MVQPPRRNHTKLAVIAVIGLAILALSVLVIVGAHSSVPSSTPSAARTTTTQVQAMVSDVPGFLGAMAKILPRTSDRELTIAGLAVCTDLRNGYTAAQEANIVARTAGLTHLTGALLVDDAITFLCPDIHDGVQLPH
jgi:hypothetical protein